MNIPCNSKSLCEEFPFLNVSSEDFDIDHCFCYSSYPGPPPGAGRDWGNPQCGGCKPIYGPQSCLANDCVICDLTCGTSPTCPSDPTQSAYVDANCNPLPIFCNVPQTCTVVLQDGASLTYTVPAGTICASSQYLADHIAYLQACDGANHPGSCALLQIPRCTCHDFLYSANVCNDTTVHLAVTAGALPPGLHLTGQAIVGTTTTAGSYAFTIRGTNARGDFCEVNYQIVVVQITSGATLPAFTVGSAYSTQLTATGGSGNYSWNIVSGSFPDGIDLSSSGLISGTPTANNGVNPILMNVVDLTCEAAQRSVYPPHISMTTVGHSTVKTFRGFPEYVYSTGALYRTVTWTGDAEQRQTILRAILNGGDFPGGGAHWIYSGASSIDIFGNYTSHHTKNMYVPCNTIRWPISNINYSPFMYFFGYCCDMDPGSCPVCDQNTANWFFDSNWASDDPNDIVWMGWLPLPSAPDPGKAVTPTSLTFNDTGYSADFPTVATGTNAPLYGGAGLNGLAGPWIGMSNRRNYGAVLSDEYTDADATNSQVVYNTNGNIAENLPRFQSYINNYVTNVASRITTCTYTLHCTHLVAGTNYRATVTFLSDLGGQSNRVVNFIATSDTFDIVDTVPAPPAGHTTTVINPKLVQVPVV